MPLSNRTLLITGFSVFQQFRYNPSSELLPVLEGQNLRGFRIVTAEIPTTFELAIPAFVQAYEREAPDLVVSLGMHSGITCFKIETRGRNCRIAESDHEQGRSSSSETIPIEDQGDSFRWSRWRLPDHPPVLASSLPEVRFSFSAGTYVCNYLYYRMLGYLEHHDRQQTKALFIHIPAFPGDVRSDILSSPGLPFPRLYHGMIQLLEVLIDSHIEQLIPNCVVESGFGG